jgi:hypothetical protein
MPLPATLAEYYADPHVRERITEYCGGTDGRAPTAVYLASMAATEGMFRTWDDASKHPLEQMDALLASAADIARSMWDRAQLLLHLDFDYLNIDRPAEAYTHPADLFYKIEPSYRAALHVFGKYGLAMLPIVTGRGYHFTAHVPLGSAVVDRLAELTPAPPRWLGSRDARRHPFATPDVTSRHARAYAGAGMLAEFLAHQIVRRARPRSPIPIVVNNTVVGTGEVGRECLSVDLSYAGDPMDVRHMRVAYSAYQKHRFRPDLSGAAATRPPLVAVPRTSESLECLLRSRSDLRHAARLARSASAALPDASDGVVRLLDAYLASPLANFHRAFSAAVPATRGSPGANDRPAVSRGLLPACVTRALAHPNDLLLQPSIVQHVTRVLLAHGLSPRDIAALIQAHYDADHDWGRRWNWMDSEARACFDVRVFSGMLVCGLDGAIDLNCRSAQEKGLCPGGECGRDLRVTRARLLEAVRS